MWIGIVLLSIQLIPMVLCQLDGWEPLGCWRDLPTRAIASLEGKSKILSGNWKLRANPLNACAEAAKEEKLKVFAVQDGGQCFGGPYAHIFYNQYGPSNLCKGGVGGVWSNSVYSSGTAYTRVLNSKKESNKLVRCSKPLDMIFLIDGSGDLNVENKLRWDQMLKFVSKATEHFDTSSTRFGVISYGSEPKTIVNIHDKKDELAMRDSIISANFPGGPRTINEALKKAWKEQLKYTDREKSRVIVALTTGNMDYGPWGSSLFLTNRGVRLLSFGIDRAPSYRYLETLSSGKHPENIYSIDTEQLDTTLPYFAKDVCTGFKKSKIETIRKDKEIDLISSHDFETVGSVVERKSGQGLDNKSKTISLINAKNAENNKDHDKEMKNEDFSEQQEKEKKLVDNNHKEMVKENSLDISNTTSAMSNEKAKEEYKIDEAKARKILPVNNSSLSDGEIVEKLKEDAVEVLKNTEHSSNANNTSSTTGSGKPVVRENQDVNNNTEDELKSSPNQTASYATEISKLWETEKYPQTTANNTYTENTTSNEKERDAQNQTSLEGFLAEFKTEDNSHSGFQNSKSNRDRDTANENATDASPEKVNNASKNFEEDKKPDAEMSKGQASEAIGKDESKNESKENFDNSAKIKESSNSTENNSASDKNQTSNSTFDLSSNNSTKSDENQNSKSQSSFEENQIKDLGEGSKDLDKEVFDGLQKQRESIGQEETEKDDESILNEVKMDHDLDTYSNSSKKASDENFIGEGMPDDEANNDEDEKATQSALEQKRKEIDVLLKKLDETRRRRKRRKVRQRSKDFGDGDGMENGSEANFMNTRDGYKEERKGIENGMETGMA